MSTPSTTAIDAALMEGIDHFERLADIIGAEGEWTPELAADVRKAAAETADAFERALVLYAVTGTDYVNAEAIAERAGIGRTTMYRRIGAATKGTNTP